MCVQKWPSNKKKTKKTKQNKIKRRPFFLYYLKSIRICLAFDPKLKNKMIIELFSKEFYLIIISFLASFIMVALFK